MAGEQPRHLLRRLQMPLGIGFEAAARRRAMVHFSRMQVSTSCKRPALGRVIEHVVGGDEGNAGARRRVGERGDAGAIVAAIGVPRREIEARCAAQRLFDAAELRFEISLW